MPICEPGQSEGAWVGIGPIYEAEGVVTSDTPTWFNDGLAFPAGHYRLTYIRGAYRATAASGWSVGSGWNCCTLSGETYPGVVAAPAAATPTGNSVPDGYYTGGDGWDTQALAQEANLAADATTFDFAGGPLGIDLPGAAANSVAGSPSPTWRLELVEACTEAAEAFTAECSELSEDISLIPDTDFIQDCEVPSAPEPITGCANQTLMVMPPMLPIVPCPALEITVEAITDDKLEEISASVSVSTGSTITECGDVACTQSAAFRFYFPLGDIVVPTYTGDAWIDITGESITHTGPSTQSQSLMPCDKLVRNSLTLEFWRREIGVDARGHTISYTANQSHTLTDDVLLPSITVVSDTWISNTATYGGYSQSLAHIGPGTVASTLTPADALRVSGIFLEIGRKPVTVDAKGHTIGSAAVAYAGNPDGVSLVSLTAVTAISLSGTDLLIKTRNITVLAAGTESGWGVAPGWTGTACP